MEPVALNVSFKSGLVVIRYGYPLNRTQDPSAESGRETAVSNRVIVVIAIVVVVVVVAIAVVGTDPGQLLQPTHLYLTKISSRPGASQGTLASSLPSGSRS
jgi:hypothetical protein